MKKAVIYWSGTGNTAAMASAIAAGMGEGTELYSVDQFTGDIADYDKIAFGCSAMGDEVLEEAEFDPFFTSIEGKLGGKKVALFGSYGWGDGQWMRDWETDCGNAGISLACDSVTCCETPDDAALAACRELGKVLAG